MKRTYYIFGLVGFLCALNFAVYAQDTTAVAEPVSEAQNPIRSEVLVETEKPQDLPKKRLLALPKEKNPKVATWLSVALPGAGQIYNGQWYKVPVIYGGVAALYYFYQMNIDERNLYQAEYRGRLSQDTLFNPNPLLVRYNNEQIRTMRDYYRRNVEFVFILSGLLYILNIVDACVFAHLSSFDVSDNLSLRIQPYATPDLVPYAASQRMPMNGGLKLTFTLK
ncbi:MAG: DUF5683 domain-containing protein [Bacteroidales bacterium]|nr:DUF5683 domain-containing protein [Bacteroidales bacterium]